MQEMEIVYLSPGELTPYEKNAKQHPPKQVEQIANSIKQFGWRQPIVVDKDRTVIIGHGRLFAAKEMGLERVPVVFADDLDEDQVKALRLADNKLNESDWDLSKLEEELAALSINGIDMSELGFTDMTESDWFSREDKDGTAREEGNDEYNEFLEKFETKKTTDDCYTPDNIYAVVADFVAQRYNVDKSTFVRPFFPGGDYRNHRYPKKCAVVDNPPFSILAEIIDFYLERQIPFFLFGPSLAAFNYISRPGVTAVAEFSYITYENGAVVKTSFLTNMEGEDVAAFTDYGLYKSIEAVNDENEAQMHVSLPKYEYPDEVLTSAKMGWLVQYGQEISVRRSESALIRALDTQKEQGKAIFGCGLLLSERKTAERAAAERAAAERAAAERAAAERAAATKWKLSDREKEIVRSLGK